VYNDRDVYISTALWNVSPLFFRETTFSNSMFSFYSCLMESALPIGLSHFMAPNFSLLAKGRDSIFFYKLARFQNLWNHKVGIYLGGLVMVMVMVILLVPQLPYLFAARSCPKSGRRPSLIAFLGDFFNLVLDFSMLGSLTSGATVFLSKST
jgi:hypothetical protein